MENTRKAINIALLIGLAMCALVSGQPKTGTVCVAPNSAEPATRISPGGEYNPGTLSLKIDGGRLLLWPHKQSAVIRSLDLNRRHLVTLTSDGKTIKSFWFRFSEYKSSDLCVSFDGYQGVQLQEEISPAASASKTEFLETRRCGPPSQVSWSQNQVHRTS
jgi:hypothetical protein